MVGITQEQAEAYCAWLTKKYMSIEKRKYKNLVFKLPTLNQWTYAAKGGIEAVLPFKNLKLADSRGVLQAHFRNINQEDIQIEKDMVKINSDITSPYYQQGCWITIVNDPTYPSISLTPSHFKLYNLAGNVKEYIAEKGITKGGGWKDTGYFLQNFVCQTYDSTNTTSEDRGFRVAMEIIK
ncbi:MAG: SUMF1/EgtB/PvdO family nonheme iron enzyme [Flavobacteriales bacterium]